MLITRSVHACSARAASVARTTASMPSPRHCGRRAGSIQSRAVTIAFIKVLPSPQDPFGRTTPFWVGQGWRVFYDGALCVHCACKSTVTGLCPSELSSPHRLGYLFPFRTAKRVHSIITGACDTPLHTRARLMVNQSMFNQRSVFIRPEDQWKEEL